MKFLLLSLASMCFAQDLQKFLEFTKIPCTLGNLDLIYVVIINQFCSIDCKEKEYFLSRHLTVTWNEAKEVCNAQGMKFLSLETVEEANMFTKLCATNYELFANDYSNYYFIGGRQKINGNFSSYYWVETGTAINYTLKWAPGEPNYSNGKAYCMSLKSDRSVFTFDDTECDSLRRNFFCEKSTKAAGKASNAVNAATSIGISSILSAVVLFRLWLN